MTIKIASIFVALLVVLFVTQSVSCEEVEIDQEVLYIINPDTVPKIVAESSNPLTRSNRSNLVCTPLTCQRICRALNYRVGRCNVNRVCVCSNF